MNLGEIVELVLEAITDDLFRTETAKKLVEQAVEIFSRDRPLQKTVEFVGDGKTFQFQLPEDFLDGFSSVQAVEYPVDSRLPCFLPQEEFIVLNVAGKPFLRLVILTPKVGERIRVFYTTIHSLTETNSTIPSHLKTAVVNKACELACRFLAGQYLKMFSPGIVAEPIDYGKKAEDYLRLAASYRDAYRAIIGSLEAQPVPYLPAIRKYGPYRERV